MGESAISLKGKVAIVTGGAGGIGAEVVRLMLERGASVAIADLNLDRAQQLASSLDEARVLALGVDLTDEASVKAMVAGAVSHFGRLDILHNNAAALSPELIGKDRDILSMEAEVWDMTFAVNCRGPMLTMREALPHLIESRGAIVNTTSNSAFQGHFLLNAYTASKAALIQMTRSVAASYGRVGVRCNSVAPGTTMTAALKATFPEALLKLVEEETLRDQIGAPEDIAEVVAFLASDAARNITGQVIVADGGFASHIPGLARTRALMEG
jgi:NAD(P)-dependent dehydrogenase (short-subunit alcohol dehydrogenase family)